MPLPRERPTKERPAMKPSLHFVTLSPNSITTRGRATVPPQAKTRETTTIKTTNHNLILLLVCVALAWITLGAQAYTINVPQGFSIMADQAVNTRCFDTFGPVPDGFAVYRWNHAIGTFTVADYVDGAWEG